MNAFLKNLFLIFGRIFFFHIDISLFDLILSSLNCENATKNVHNIQKISSAAVPEIVTLKLSSEIFFIRQQ